MVWATSYLRFGQPDFIGSVPLFKKLFQDFIKSADLRQKIEARQTQSALDKR
jgi:hypothetical protein